jgi:hypothetical protein
VILTCELPLSDTSDHVAEGRVLVLHGRGESSQTLLRRAGTWTRSKAGSAAASAKSTRHSGGSASSSARFSATSRPFASFRGSSAITARPCRSTDARIVLNGCSHTFNHRLIPEFLMRRRLNSCRAILVVADDLLRASVCLTATRSRTRCPNRGRQPRRCWTPAHWLGRSGSGGRASQACPCGQC